MSIPLDTMDIYILAVFIEKPYSKPLECSVVYIPVITLGPAMSVMSK